ncbi:hypothetical protein LVP1_g056 [Lactobacillus phage P1]|uniref:Uncharacterized protein n=1 Tax=Lactobacillus phage P1 TaxID=1846168 RepID=A0A1S5RCU1_9CAUD|nr:hypothetical protein HOR15_gp33 [Lactobacillus phage P1]ANO57985.1 hypothetical protein LVP1_g056 [Lactobacillus phage P1]APU93340.1 hypothetical protein LVP2_g066 [Lactobacillus phage P2]
MFMEKFLALETGSVCISTNNNQSDELVCFSTSWIQRDV